MTINLQYPETIEKTGFYLNFIAYDYKTAPGIKTNTGTSARSDIRTNLGGAGSRLSQFGRKISDFNIGTEENKQTLVSKGESGLGSVAGSSGQGEVKGNVALYVPQNLEYSYGATWEAMQFGILGAAMGTNNAGDFAANIGAIAGATGGSVLANIGLDAASKVIPKVNNLDLDNLIGGAFGVTFNDNTLQTFDSMQPREFSFKYIMVSRNANEEDEIRKIIKFFKAAMHPAAQGNSRNNTVFLNYPYIFEIRPSGYNSTVSVKQNNTITVKSGTSYSNFLPRTRYCGMKSFNVNYTPNNVISLTPGSFVTAAEISMSFVELTNLTRQDINEFEDATDLTLD